MRTLKQYKRAVADNMRVTRESVGFTQLQLSEVTGLARSHISALEQGDGNPNLDSLYAISHALGVTVEDLLHEIDGQWEQ